MGKKTERIRELEAELAELRDEEPEPLTLAQIRELSAEEVEEHWARIQKTLGDVQEREPKTPAEHRHRSNERISGALNPDAMGQREKRRKGSTR